MAPGLKRLLGKLVNDIYSFQALLQIFQDECIDLLWCHHNEPSKKKDQCDRQIAATRTILKSYADSGNNTEWGTDMMML